MKHKNISWPLFVLLFVGIYVLTITVAVIIVIPITYNAHEHLRPVAQETAEEYWELGEFSQTVVAFRASSFIYNADGVLLDSFITEDNHMNFSDRSDKLLKQIKDTGEGIYKLIYDSDLDGRLAMIMAVPRFENGNLQSVFFFVKSLTSQFGNLAILFVAITLTLALSAIYLGLIMNQNHKTEKIRRDYVANVSHDLKSPISSISSLAEVMSEGIVRDEAKIKKYSGIILKEAHSLEKTVSSMLSLSKLQSGQKVFSKTTVTADTLLCPIIERYGAICDQRGIKLHVQEDSSSLPDLFTNIARASELLDTLIDNAVKFAEKPGHIHLTWTLSQKFICFCVSDDGVGISKNDQPHIFERFYRGESESTGSGLGLAIASEIADGLDEKLWVQSDEGVGSFFFFTIHLK